MAKGLRTLPKLPFEREMEGFVKGLAEQLRLSNSDLAGADLDLSSGIQDNFSEDLGQFFFLQEEGFGINVGAYADSPEDFRSRRPTNNRQTTLHAKGDGEGIRRNGPVTETLFDFLNGTSRDLSTKYPTTFTVDDRVEPVDLGLRFFRRFSGLLAETLLSKHAARVRILPGYTIVVSTRSTSHKPSLLNVSIKDKEGETVFSAVIYDAERVDVMYGGDDPQEYHHRIKVLFSSDGLQVRDRNDDSGATPAKNGAGSTLGGVKRPPLKKEELVSAARSFCDLSLANEGDVTDDVVRVLDADMHLFIRGHFVFDVPTQTAFVGALSGYKVETHLASKGLSSATANREAHKRTIVSMLAVIQKQVSEEVWQRYGIVLQRSVVEEAADDGENLVPSFLDGEEDDDGGAGDVAVVEVETLPLPQPEPQPQSSTTLEPVPTLLPDEPVVPEEAILPEPQSSPVVPLQDPPVEKIVYDTTPAGAEYLAGLLLSSRFSKYVTPKVMEDVAARVVKAIPEAIRVRGLLEVVAATLIKGLEAHGDSKHKSEVFRNKAEIVVRMANALGVVFDAVKVPAEEELRVALEVLQSIPPHSIANAAGWHAVQKAIGLLIPGGKTPQETVRLIKGKFGYEAMLKLVAAAYDVPPHDIERGFGEIMGESAKAFMLALSLYRIAYQIGGRAFYSNWMKWIDGIRGDMVDTIRLMTLVRIYFPADMMWGELMISAIEDTVVEVSGKVLMNSQRTSIIKRVLINVIVAANGGWANPKLPIEKLFREYFQYDDQEFSDRFSSLRQMSPALCAAVMRTAMENVDTYSNKQLVSALVVSENRKFEDGMEILTSVYRRRHSDLDTPPEALVSAFSGRLADEVGNKAYSFSVADANALMAGTVDIAEEIINLEPAYNPFADSPLVALIGDAVLEMYWQRLHSAMPDLLRNRNVADLVAHVVSVHVASLSDGDLSYKRGAALRDVEMFERVFSFFKILEKIAEFTPSVAISSLRALVAGSMGKVKSELLSGYVVFECLCQLAKVLSDPDSFGGKYAESLINIFAAALNVEPSQIEEAMPGLDNVTRARLLSRGILTLHKYNSFSDWERRWANLVVTLYVIANDEAAKYAKILPGEFSGGVNSAAIEVAVDYSQLPAKQVQERSLRRSVGEAILKSLDKKLSELPIRELFKLFFGVDDEWIKTIFGDAPPHSVEWENHGLESVLRKTGTYSNQTQASKFFEGYKDRLRRAVATAKGYVELLEREVSDEAAFAAAVSDYIVKKDNSLPEGKPFFIFGIVEAYEFLTGFFGFENVFAEKKESVRAAIRAIGSGVYFAFMRPALREIPEALADAILIKVGESGKTGDWQAQRQLFEPRAKVYLDVVRRTKAEIGRRVVGGKINPKNRDAVMKYVIAKLVESTTLQHFGEYASNHYLQWIDEGASQ